MGEIDKSRELYSKEGDNSSRFEGKTVPWEHTIAVRLIVIDPSFKCHNKGPWSCRHDIEPKNSYFEVYFHLGH